MGKPHAQRQAEIIQSALALAAETGERNVTTQAIADRVGIAQATVFRHFGSRDAIFTSAINWLASQLFETLSPCFNAISMQPDERLKLLISGQLGLISRHKGLPRLLFSDRLHKESPALKATVQAIITRYITQVSRLIEDGIETGCFQSELDPDDTARLVAALIQGTVMRWSLFEFNFDLEGEVPQLQSFVLRSVSQSIQN